MGTSSGIFGRWKHADTLQKMTPNLTMDAPSIIALPLSAVENMSMELAWRFTDLFEQIEKIQKHLEELKGRLLADTL